MACVDEGRYSVACCARAQQVCGMGRGLAIKEMVRCHLRDNLFRGGTISKVTRNGSESREIVYGRHVRDAFMA